MDTQILIVGGGLSGLALARRLDAAGIDWQLVEARARWGGRILTRMIEQQNFDFGPSWFWPGQPRITTLIQQLGLVSFDQAYQGEQLYQDERGQVHRGQGMVSMQGSWRIQGGMAELIAHLVTDLPAERLHLNSGIKQVSQLAQGVQAQSESGDVYFAETVVLAVPPRVALQLTFEPALSDSVTLAASNVSTWMAGHAKAVAVYEHAFWKEQGLSGDASSRIGPLVEVHDASPAAGGPYALFGFVGVPAEQRKGNAQALEQAIQNQLIQLFGQAAADPISLEVKDWAFDSRTATALDQQPVYQHPAYGRAKALSNLWQDRLHFGSTEMGAEFGGFLEGALEVADEVAETVIQKINRSSA